MAKQIYQGFFQDGTGRAIPSGNITVYLANGTTKATIYPKRGTADKGSSATADSDSVVASASNGYFAFYVDDGDYAPGQKFKVTLSKTGYTAVSLDDIELI